VQIHSNLQVYIREGGLWHVVVSFHASEAAHPLIVLSVRWILWLHGSQKQA
jgi:hypothetical protein